MKPSQLVRQLAAWRASARPTIAIWGAPGVGKSDIVRETAAEGGEQFLDFRALLHDPSDLKFPLVEGGRVRWVQSIFPTDPGWTGIILLDELPNAPPLMQSALLQLTLDRRLGEYTLPSGAWVIAAGNRPEDRAGAGRIITSLATRFVCQITLEADPGDWQAWALDHGIHPAIRSFLQFKTTLLHSFDPACPGAQPTPRTWAFLSHVIPTAIPGAELELYQGVVGKGPAAEFLAHQKIHDSLPDPDDILKNPGKVRIPSEPEVVYALVSTIVDRCRGADLDTLGNGMVFCKRLKKEFGAFLFRGLLCKKNNDLHGVEKFRTITEFNELCTSMAEVYKGI